MKKRTWRWKKFGLRTLFVLVTICGLLFGFWVYPSLRQERIVQNLTDRGFLVRYDFASEMPTGKAREFIRKWLGKDFLYDVHAVTMFSPTDGQVSSEDMEKIGKFKHLRQLVLYHGKLMPGDLQHLQKLDDLQRLELLVDGITDEDLKDVSQLNLRQINLGDLPITDGGVKHLQDMKSIRMLKLDGTNITDKAVGYFSNLPSLEFLGLRGTKITDSALEQIASAPSHESIKTLMLYSTSISTDGFKHLVGLPNLTYLDAENTKLDDDALPFLAKLKQLETLNLSFTKVTADGLEKLNLPKLSTLELRGTKVQPNELTEFKRQHPKCAISF